MKDITFIKATEGPFNYNRSLDYREYIDSLRFNYAKKMLMLLLFLFF